MCCIEDDSLPPSGGRRRAGYPIRRSRTTPGSAGRAAAARVAVAQPGTSPARRSYPSGTAPAPGPGRGCSRSSSSWSFRPRTHGGGIRPAPVPRAKNIHREQHRGRTARQSSLPMIPHRRPGRETGWRRRKAGIGCRDPGRCGVRPAGPRSAHIGATPRAAHIRDDASEPHRGDRCRQAALWLRGAGRGPKSVAARTLAPVTTPHHLPLRAAAPRLARRVAAGEPPLGRARRVERMLRELAATLPDAHCGTGAPPPRTSSATAAILSARKPTDVRVNQRSPRSCSPATGRPPSYASAERAELEELSPLPRASPARTRPRGCRRPGRRSRREARRRAAAQARRAGRAAGHRPQDRRRHPRQRGRHHRASPSTRTSDAWCGDGAEQAEDDPVKVEHAVGALVPQARLDDRVAPGDLPRAAPVPRPQAGVRRLRPRGRLPRLRHRAHGPGPGRGAGQGPEPGTPAAAGGRAGRR